MLCTDECLAHSSGLGGPYGKNSYCQDGGIQTTWQLGAGCGAYPGYGCQLGLNDVYLYDLSLEECQAACVVRPTCLSIDWYVGRTGQTCSLSDSNTCSLTNTSDCRYYGKDIAPSVTGASCAFGTDCTDCGPRYMSPPPSQPPPPPPSPPPCSTDLSMTCGSQGCFDIYQAGDHHHIVTSNSASSLTITYGKGDTLGAWHPNSPWTCTCTAASCAKLVGTFKCSADFYGSTSLEIGLSNGAYTFEPFDGTALVVRTCELSSDKNSLQVKYQQDFFSPSCEPLQAQEDAEDIVEAHATEKDEM